MELYRRCDEVLHYIWDPIGVSGVPPARDEYDSYLPQVFSLVKDEKSSKEIVDYLVDIETNRIGLPPNPSRSEEVANVLLEWRRWIWESTG